MEFLVRVTGKVNHPISLDPTVWIFDDRRIDLDQFFETTYEEIDEDEKYLRGMGKHWSREIMEGATMPPTLEAERNFELKEKKIEETFGMFFHHFLKNAEPHEDATKIVFERNEGEEISVPLEKLDSIIFQYSANGQPLREDGPVYVLWKDGSNRHDPIKHVQNIRID